MGISMRFEDKGGKKNTWREEVAVEKG